MPIPAEKPKSASTAGEPTVAVLLTWFLPGAGHLYLGKLRFAIGAFVLVQGLYLLGILLSGGMFLEYLPSEMRSRFAGVLTPEVGNLGALLFHINRFGFGGADPRVWPSTMDIGTTLTAMSGVLNLFVMSRAHIDARVAQRPSGGTPGPAVCALATWLVPGLGQFLQGRRARGVLVFVLLVGLFLIGCALAQGANLDRERHFYYWAGQFLLGAPAIVAEFIHGHPLVTTDIPYVDAGVVIGCVAGMLNVLVMLDAYGYGESRLLGEPAAGSTDRATEEAAA